MRHFVTLGDVEQRVAGAHSLASSVPASPQYRAGKLAALAFFRPEHGDAPMHTSLMASIAGTLATVGVVCSAIWWHDRPTTATRGAHVAATRPLLRTLAPVDKAPHDELQRQLARQTDGNVVLDMRSLESLDGAITQVEHWRNKHPPEAYLVCWLAAPDDEELLTAVRSLSQAGCSSLRVALVEVTASTD